ncbi:MAG TPA: siderophore-interacting protein [Microbacterium sp.]|uniref:siderophore-interacting protein n=1 Tax=unclassified Microbacterium TaxID=2609290 RepID=UPI000C656474|nr:MULTISPECIES: siderophore-interacting protein [unclassified Microbacterium]MBU19889.1 NADPH-dependent ferric siderophore reductase [Microbacterium sp.]HBS07682.1 siderophore-interacting protein [Microbacterium sp.]|tara:strand:- start:40 stop:849 length:810 start_codon:yes stop_codon:yes gene_type:complete
MTAGTETQSAEGAASQSFALVRTPLDLRMRSVVLAERTWQTDTYVRVRVTGEDLAGFQSLGSDDHLRIFFPDEPVTDPEQLRRTPSREYTPFEWGEGWLELEFVIHGGPGERGIAAEWAATAPLGSPAVIGGPRGSLVIEGAPDAWFLAGDETAVPAIRRFAALMSEDATGTILVEVPDADRELPVTAPAGVTVRQLHRDGRAEGEVLTDALAAVGDRPEGDVFAFVAAEQSIVKPARALLIEKWGLESSRITVKGYWKRGESEYHAPL